MEQPIQSVFERVRERERQRCRKSTFAFRCRLSPATFSIIHYLQTDEPIYLRYYQSKEFSVNSHKCRQTHIRIHIPYYIFHTIYIQAHLTAFQLIISCFSCSECKQTVCCDRNGRKWRQTMVGQKKDHHHTIIQHRTFFILPFSLKFILLPNIFSYYYLLWLAKEAGTILSLFIYGLSRCI